MNVTGQHKLLAWLVVASAVMLGLTALAPVFLSNLGWLELARAHAFAEARQVRSAEALEKFQRVVAAHRLSRETYLGMGLAQAIAGDELAALSSFRNAGITSQALVDFGHQAQAYHRWDDALAYYKSAANLDPGQPNEGQFLAASICQLAFAQPDMLNQHNQAYCYRQLSQHDGNLIINSHFNSRNTWGWGKRYFSGPTSVIYGVDDTRGKPAPAALIIGLTEDHHGGLVQGITLQSGITVRYSAWVKIQSDKGTNVRLLYFGGQMGGKPMSSILETVSDDIEWTYFEKVLQVPTTDDGLLWFFPAFLTGKGKVWIDDVRLEILSSRTGRS